MNALAGQRPYYEEKLDSLREIFGTTDVEVLVDFVRVGDAKYRVIDDVIILLPREKLPPRLRGGVEARATAEYAPDIQSTFGEEWKTFDKMLPDHERLFAQYFDQVDLDGLRDARVADLGCGMGRWSFFMAPRCREIVLVDFSEAIFVARDTLRDSPNALFFMGDVTELPFRDDFADLAFSLGVLHHLPIPALDAVRKLRRASARLVVYLYYALDNRPAHYRVILRGVDGVRSRLSRVRGARSRAAITWALALGVYRPLVGLGHLLRPFGAQRFVPLHEGYRGKSLKLIRQDAYDRFFTRIEQRVSRAQIETLADSFSVVRVAQTFPFWHFVVER